MPFFSSPNIVVSIKAIRLSGTGAFVAAGVAAGLGKGVGVGLGAVVCGRVCPATATAIKPINISAEKISLFITSPGACEFLSTDYTDYAEKEKGDVVEV